MDARHKRRLQRLIDEAYNNWQTYYYAANNMVTGATLIDFNEKAREWHTEYVELKKQLSNND